MAVDVKLQIDQEALKRVEKMLRGFPKAIPKVMTKGINKTAAGAKTDIARKIAGEIKLKLSTIKKSIDMSKASYSRWQAELGIYGRRIPLINFAARQTKAGVTYSIEPGSRKTIGSAFIQTMGSGHVGIFKRVTEARHPIRELMGPSLGIVFNRSGSIARESLRSAEQKLKHNIAVQTQIFLDKSRGAA